MNNKKIVKQGITTATHFLQRHAPQSVVGMPSIADLEKALGEINASSKLENPPKLAEDTFTPPQPPEGQETALKEAGTGCIPCANSHLATCAGLLNEAVRFAREDITNPEVSDRVDKCLSEITAMERVDLAPEKIVDLPQKEKEISDMAATKVREIRHQLEWFKSREDLEKVAADTAKLQHEVSRKWLLARLSREDKERVRQKAAELISKELEG